MLIRNALNNTAGRISQIILALVAVPIFLNKLGTNLYGIYITILSFIGYLAVLDFGIAQGLIKYVAEYSNLNSKSLHKTINTAFCVQLFIIITWSILILLISNHVPIIFKINSGLLF